MYTNRRALLAQVHIAKKQLGLDDPTYRAVLERETGKRSAADCSDTALRRVLDGVLNVLPGGTPPTGPPGRKNRLTKRSLKPWVRKVYKLWWLAADAGVVAVGKPCQGTHQSVLGTRRGAAQKPRCLGGPVGGAPPDGGQKTAGRRCGLLSSARPVLMTRNS